MYIERLGLRHFRLYSQQTFTFSPHFNLIEGPNARGKTALLEAIYLAAVGSSFRTHRSVDLIRHDSAGFTVDILYYHGTVEQHIRIALTPDERCVYINGTRNSSLSSVLGGMKATVLTPDDCALIKGAPQLRRHYLDLQLGQVDPLYNHHLKRYARALKQRNCLLKMGSAAT
jgi:DNA replication and repair protein RecF